MFPNTFQLFKWMNAENIHNAFAEKENIHNAFAEKENLQICFWQIALLAEERKPEREGKLLPTIRES